LRKLLDARLPRNVRAKIARWILVLDELLGVADEGRRSWFTRDEWIDAGALGRDPEEWFVAHWRNSGPKKDLERCEEWLASVGAELRVVDRKKDLGESRIEFDPPVLRDLLEPEMRAARIENELAAARREKREPDLSWLVHEEPSVLNLQQEYQDIKRPRSLRLLSRKHGITRAKLHERLKSAGTPMRPARRMRISEQVGPERTKRALEVHDKGGTLEDVRRELGLATKWSAHRFLEAHGRDTRPREARAKPPPAEAPPGWRMLPRCGRSATCA
jgi:hypothetical protein